MSEVKKLAITEPYIALDAQLGEAPYWHAPSNTLRFVDIDRRHLHQVDLAAGPESLKTFELSDCVTSTAEIAGDGKRDFVFGGKAGVGIMNRETGEWRYLRRYWDEGTGKQPGAGTEEKVRRFRGNDGAVDIKGRYFVSVMNDPKETEIKNEGTLFRFDPDLSLHKVIHPVAIPNGISWSSDSKFVYWTNSTDNRILKYPYHAETGDIELDKGEVFFQCPYEGGVPDGHARDEKGHFWIACYGSGKVVEVDEQGKVLTEVSVPTRCVTCPCIAGEDLFITSAEEEDKAKYPDSAKHTGGLFRIHIGVKGAPLNAFQPAQPLAV